MDGNLLLLPNEDGTLEQQIYINMSIDVGHQYISLQKYHYSESMATTHARLIKHVPLPKLLLMKEIKKYYLVYNFTFI